MDRISDLTLFLRVLDLGSISAAARSLGLSLAVASQRLKRLERGLGVRLLHRTTRKLHATPEGTALAERGRRLIEDLEGLAGDLRQSGIVATGTLRVTVPASFGRQYISPILPEFLRRHPRVRLNVDFTDQMIDLISSGVDLAIRIGKLDNSGLVARRLAADQRILCASPDYLRRHGAPTAPDDLAKHDCLILVGHRGPQDVWTLLNRKRREVRIRVHGALETNLGESLRDAALAGLGIALHSTWLVCDDLRSGRLKVVLPNYPVIESGIYAVMPQRHLVPTRVRAFIDFLAERFGDHPPWERHLARRPAIL
jgi:DNA-binding transcriptional LysR family regulator